MERSSDDVSRHLFNTELYRFLKGFPVASSMVIISRFVYRPKGRQLSFHPTLNVRGTRTVSQIILSPSIVPLTNYRLREHNYFTRLQT